MSVKKHPFNILLSGADRNAIDLIRKKLDCTRAEVMRIGLKSLYMHIMQQIPTCPDGQRCVCPHLVQYPTQGTVCPSSYIENQMEIK